MLLLNNVCKQFKYIIINNACPSLLDDNTSISYITLVLLPIKSEFSEGDAADTACKGMAMHRCNCDSGESLRILKAFEHSEKFLIFQNLFSGPAVMMM
jgi:hypothetical protein